jgi:phospholipid transport system substrate-binding protein
LEKSKLFKESAGMDAKRFCSRLIFFIVVFGIAAFAMAGEPTQQIKQTTDRILAILADPALKPPAKSEERKKLIGKAVDERFDWEEMARRSLARHWAQRTIEEKKEFVPLFRSLLEQTYLDKVQGYSGEKVIYEGDSVDGDYGLAKVKIWTTANKEIPVEYRLLKRGNNWFVYDISIEGISLINNYRSQFNSIITKSSYKELVQKLKAKALQ